jgi:hypothetical protein
VQKFEDVGAIAIGRNEGERLRACLTSLLGRAAAIVYVDSGSTDGSSELAKSLGVEVLDLDLTIPFTAARARNAGYSRLREILPNLRYVQFVDGDCEVVAGWIETARARLEEREELGAVCGRRRERHPESSIYNRLCDIEWDTPVGDALACGGDSLMRANAFDEVGGFDSSLIAGEEPELCVRLRARGWKIERLDHEMTLHDAAMTRFSQWWKRSMRAGHAFAEGSDLHGAPPERHWVRETRRAYFWGVGLPLASAALAPITGGASMALLLGYPVVAARTYGHARSRGHEAADSALYAVACTVSKFPEAVGAIRYHWGRRFGERSRLIEYKS